MIGGRRPLSGRKPGDRRIRVDRPHSPFFRYTGPGQLTAKAAASAPTTARGSRVRAGEGHRSSVGPLATEEEIGERLSKKKALAIFSSDAISSSAYATEEILLAFVLTGGAAARRFNLAIPIAIAIAGAARDRRLQLPPGLHGLPHRRRLVLGVQGQLRPARVARRRIGAAHRLHADGRRSRPRRRASRSSRRSPPSTPVQVEIAVGAVVLITLGNLRGLREAGNIFAIPTYLFLGSALLHDRPSGVFRIVVLGEHGAPPPEVVAGDRPDRGRRRRSCILLRAFASGAVALTGTEAIATGVPAFKPPEAKNAATTLIAMASILAILFIGITFLATQLRASMPDRGAREQTVIAQIAAPRLRRRSRSASTCSRRSPRCCCSWPRTPRSPRSRGWPPSSPRTASSRASSPSAATGWRSRPAS